MPDRTQAFYDALSEDYDAIYENWDESVRRQGELLARLLGEADPVLDLAAGMGTQAIGLALHGRCVVARDISRALVARGLERAARFGVQVPFEIWDMRAARPEDAGRFEAAIAFDNALPHLLTDDDLHAALRAVHAALRPGGRFLASIRDYDALGDTRPRLEAARVLGSAPSAA